MISDCVHTAIAAAGALGAQLEDQVVHNHNVIRRVAATAMCFAVYDAHQEAIVAVALTLPEPLNMALEPPEP